MLVLATLLPLAATAAEEGKKIMFGMLIVGLIFLGRDPGRRRPALPAAAPGAGAREQAPVGAGSTRPLFVQALLNPASAAILFEASSAATL